MLGSSRMTLQVCSVGTSHAYLEAAILTTKYQVFISSTYDDLRNEREQVLKATLEMGHIPVGMEMFSAADEEQWRIITRQIDECDYYAVILAHRYGSTIDGISYTEKEYDYATSKGIPVLGFMIEDGAPWPADRIETAARKKQSLDRFKTKVKAKPVSFWNSASDLHGKFSIALMKQIASTPRPGWARATNVAGPEVIKELTRLSSENADLRHQLSEALRKAEDDSAAEINRISDTLKNNKRSLSFWYRDGSDWEDKTEVGMLSLFLMLAPEMMIETSTNDIADNIGFQVRPNKERTPRRSYPVPSNVVRLLISDFVAIGVCEPSQKRHSVSDTKEYWSLTEKGRQVLTRARHEILFACDRASMNDRLEEIEAEDASRERVPKQIGAKSKKNVTMKSKKKAATKPKKKKTG